MACASVATGMLDRAFNFGLPPRSLCRSRFLVPVTSHRRKGGRLSGSHARVSIFVQLSTLPFPLFTMYPTFVLTSRLPTLLLLQCTARGSFVHREQINSTHRDSLETLWPDSKAPPYILSYSFPIGHVEASYLPAVVVPRSPRPVVQQI